MDNLKVLIIIDSLTSGGKERRLVELLKGLVKYTHLQCELVLLSKTVYYDDVYKLGLKIHVLERKWKKDPSIFAKLYRICKQFHPDILHSCEGMASIYSLPVAKLLRIRFINAMISNAPARLKPFSQNWIRSKLTFPFSNMIVSNSKAGLKSYHVKSSKGHFIHNGFDPKRINQLDDAGLVKKKHGIKTPKVIGMIGAFESRKDFKTFIQAAIDVVTVRDDTTFLTIGDGSNREGLEKQVPDQFKDQIKFLGKQNQVESIINIFTIGVLATNHLVHGEGIPNVVMEYMALGKPVVATSGGGTDELVLHEQTGYLIEPMNAKELEMYLMKLLDDPELAIKLGISGKERIEKEFSLDKMTEAYVSLYELLKGN